MNLLKKDERKHLGLFYLFTALEATFAVVWVYWIVYLLDKGFSYRIVGLALAINGLSLAIFEVPTGALADAVSRKLSVIAGLIGFALVLFVIPSIENPLTLILVFAAWGFPTTLMSGASQAWVVDNLEAENRKDLITEYYVKNISLTNVGFILASILSSVIVLFLGMDFLWYVQGAALLGSVLALAAQKEHFERKATSFKKSFGETYKNIREGAAFTVKNKNVLYIMVASFFIVVSGEFLFICSKPFMEVMGVPREYFGYISAVGAALCVGMPFSTRYLANFFKKEKYYLSVHSLLFGIAIASVILVSTPVMAAFFFVVTTMRYSTSTPVIEPFFQGFLPTKLRATVGSFRNMVVAVAFLVGDSAISLFTDSVGPQVMIAVGGLIMLPSIVFYLGIKPTAQTE